MRIVAGVVGLVLVLVILWEAFETIVLPRRVTRMVRLTRVFYRATWLPWSGVARRVLSPERREAVLAFYGPLSLLLLLTVWAAGLIVGFGLVGWAAGSGLNVPDRAADFAADVYMSGTTFFTLGLGDVTPRTSFARALTVIEAGMGFGFLALVIGYVPVLYQSFSRREVRIALLDARAGSPPTAAELLRRHAHDRDRSMEALERLLHEWEYWSAELLESHLSYPVLAYFRSQHDNQSWLAALTTILDASALVMVGVRGTCRRQAELTFAMARHAIGDLARVFRVAPQADAPDRLPPVNFARLCAYLASTGMDLRHGPGAEEELAKLRALYEPFVVPLADYLEMALAEWLPDVRRADNWQTTAWDTPVTGQ